MDQLKKKILSDGVGIGTEIVKVDSFLNHQMDVELLNEMGKELARRYAGRGINRILTIEASGIALAAITAMHFDCIPVVFAKKMKPTTMTEDFYAAEVRSFTKGITSVACVSKNYVHPGDKVLIIDDFLAHGQAGIGLANIVEQAGAEVVGFGIAIEKAFQSGGKTLRDAGYQVESLAVISAITDGVIQFQ